MSEPVQVNVVQQAKKEGTWDRFKRWARRTPPTTLKESERFSRLGYLQYPLQQQLERRLNKLEDVLDEIENDLEVIEAKRLAGEDLAPYAFRDIKRLFKAFMLVGGPWFRGLNNRELAKKANIFFKLEKMVGHLPAFYPDLKRCTEILINLSWQALDVTKETPVLMETKAAIMPGYGGLDADEIIRKQQTTDNKY